MRSRLIGGLVAALTLCILAIASVPVSALSTTIPASGSFTFRIPALEGDRISFDWVADQSVSFSITDPNGDSIYSFSGAIRVGHVDATMTGEYTLHWTNSHASSVGLDYTVTTSTFERLSAPVVAAIAAVIIIVVIVIVVIIVVVVARPKPSGPPGQYAPYAPPGTPPMAGQYVGPPTPEGNCPRCGSVVSSGAAFCMKCGARLK